MPEIVTIESFHPLKIVYDKDQCASKVQLVLPPISIRIPRDGLMEMLGAQASTSYPVAFTITSPEPIRVSELVESLDISGLEAAARKMKPIIEAEFAKHPRLMEKMNMIALEKEIERF
jgi:hypothetical protein